MSYFGGELWGKIKNSFESISDTLISIDYTHATIHKGKNFAAEHDFGVVLKSGGTAEILLQVPADTYPHLYQKDVNPDARPGKIEIFEGTTFSAAGTAKDVKNLNRNSSNTNNMTVSANPTLTADGTRIDVIEMTASKSSSDSSLKYIEWDLRPDTTYMIRYTNQSTADTTVALAKIAWYE